VQPLDRRAASGSSALILLSATIRPAWCHQETSGRACSRPLPRRPGGTSSTPDSLASPPAVGQLPPAGRPQPRCGPHRADHRAVGERDTGRTVPRLIRLAWTVERAAGGVHLGVVFPRLPGSSSEPRAAGRVHQVQQLENLVEGGESDAPRYIWVERSRSPWMRLLAAAPRGPASGSGCPDRVDLAFVRHVAEGWASGQDGNVFRGERLCTSAIALSSRSSVRSAKNAGAVGCEHALVDEGAARQRGEVGASPSRRCPVGAFAQAEGQAVQRDAGRRGCPSTARAATNRCAQRGMQGLCGRADSASRPGCTVSSASQHPQVLLGGDPLDQRDGLVRWSSRPAGTRSPTAYAPGGPSWPGSGSVSRPRRAAAHRVPGRGCRRRPRWSARPPADPRCSRLASAVSPSATMEWLRRPVRVGHHRYGRTHRVRQPGS